MVTQTALGAAIPADRQRFTNTLIRSAAHTNATMRATCKLHIIRRDPPAGCQYVVYAHYMVVDTGIDGFNNT